MSEKYDILLVNIWKIQYFVGKWVKNNLLTKYSIFHLFTNKISYFSLIY